MTTGTGIEGRGLHSLQPQDLPPTSYEITPGIGKVAKDVALVKVENHM
jgi:hypothetical protein